MSFQGMNLDQANSVVSRINQYADQTEQYRTYILGAVDDMIWLGPDRDKYAGEVNNLVTGTLASFVNGLRAQVQLLLKQIEQQTQVSTGH